MNRISGVVAGRDGSAEILERVAVGFAGPDPQRVIDRGHEDLAVADLAGAGAGGDDVDGLGGELRRNSDFDSELGPEIHDIFGAAVDFGVALLAPITLDLGDRHAVDADGGQRLAHFVQLEGLDDGDDELHGLAFISVELRWGAKICTTPTLASFYANGTKSLQSQPKNDCGKLPSLDSLIPWGLNISLKSDLIASGLVAHPPASAF